LSDARKSTSPQVPLLAVGTISFMSLDHPALATQGFLWFPDLTKACLSFEGASQVVSTGDVYISNEESKALRDDIAPMGVYGVILPTAFYLVWQDNLANTMRAVSHFYLQTFAKTTFLSGVLKGRSRAQAGIARNVVCFNISIRSQVRASASCYTTMCFWYFSDSCTSLSRSVSSCSLPCRVMQ
jgi:hypothetical protein